MEAGVPAAAWRKTAELPTATGCWKQTRRNTRARTERNVQDSDATLILCRGTPRGGTELTVRLAQQHGRPYRVVDLDAPPSPGDVADWLRAGQVGVLNVAGPRESQGPGIGPQAAEFLRHVLSPPVARDG